MTIRIGVIGLGYVGLPLALAFAKKFPKTVGFDVNAKKVQLLQSGIDVNNEGFEKSLKDSTLKITGQIEDLKGVNFFVVAVPTPVDVNHNPGAALERTFDVPTAVSLANGLVEEITESRPLAIEEHLESLKVMDKLPRWREIAEEELQEVGPGVVPAQ